MVLRVLPVLHRPEVVDIGVNTIAKYAICLKDYRIRSFLSIRHSHGDLCQHLGIDSSADLNDNTPIPHRPRIPRIDTN